MENHWKSWKLSAVPGQLHDKFDKFRGEPPVHPLGRLHPQIQRVLDLNAAGPPHPFWKIYMNQKRFLNCGPQNHSVCIIYIYVFYMIYIYTINHCNHAFFLFFAHPWWNPSFWGIPSFRNTLPWLDASCARGLGLRRIASPRPTRHSPAETGLSWPLVGLMINHETIIVHRFSP